LTDDSRMRTRLHDVSRTSFSFLSCYSTVKVAGALVLSSRGEARRVEAWQARRDESIVIHQDEVKAGSQRHVTRPTDCDYKRTYRNSMQDQRTYLCSTFVGHTLHDLNGSVLLVCLPIKRCWETCRKWYMVIKYVPYKSRLKRKYWTILSWKKQFH